MGYSVLATPIWNSKYLPFGTPACAAYSAATVKGPFSVRSPSPSLPGSTALESKPASLAEPSRGAGAAPASPRGDAALPALASSPGGDTVDAPAAPPPVPLVPAAPVRPASWFRWPAPHPHAPTTHMATMRASFIPI